jgi:hypothetical protein
MYLRIPEDLDQVDRNTYYAIAKDHGEGYEVGGFCLGEVAHDDPEWFKDGMVLTLVNQPTDGQGVMDMIGDL